MHKFIGFVSLLLIVSFLAAVVFNLKTFAAEGIIMEQVRFPKGSTEKQMGKIWISDNKIKFQDENEGAAAIFDLNSGVMIQIDSTGRRYVSAKPEEYFKFIQEITSKMKTEIGRQLSQLPPDKKAQMEEMMKAQGIPLPGKTTKPKNFTLQKTDKSESIAGYKSVKYEIYEDGRLAEEVWTNYSVVNDVIDMQKLSGYFQKIKDLSESAESLALDSKGQMVYKEVFESGFPMKKIDYDSDGTTYVEEVTNVSKSDIPDSEFQPPADYKKITMQEMMSQFGN